MDLRDTKMYKKKNLDFIPQTYRLKEKDWLLLNYDKWNKRANVGWCGCMQKEIYKPTKEGEK